MTRNCAFVGLLIRNSSIWYVLTTGHPHFIITLIRYGIKPVYVCGSQLANKLKSFASVVCSTQLLQIDESCTWGLWCKTPTSCTYIRTCRLAGHDSKMRDNVSQVLASMHNFLKRYKVMHVGACGARFTNSLEVMHIWACGAQFERWNLVTQVLACDAQLLKTEKSCARGDFLVQNSQP